MTQPNEKLIDAKQKIAEQRSAKGVGTGQGAAEKKDRLPPGQRLASGFPVLDLGIQPEINISDWSLEISGAAEKRVFKCAASPTGSGLIPTTYYPCVTTCSIFDAKVEGVLWKDLMAVSKQRPNRKHP